MIDRIYEAVLVQGVVQYASMPTCEVKRFCQRNRY